MTERSESDADNRTNGEPAAADDPAADAPEAGGVVPNRRERRRAGKAQPQTGHGLPLKPRGAAVHQRSYTNRKHG